MAFDAGVVFATLGGRFSRQGFAEFDAAMKRSGAQMDTFERRQAAAAARVGTAHEKMGRAVKLAAIGGGAAFTYAAYKSIKTAADFEAAMRNVNSIAGLSEVQLRKVSAAVREMGTATGQEPVKLAQGLYELVSTGYKAQDALKVLKVSAIAASAGLTDTRTAVDTITGALKAYNLPASAAQKVSDDLFQTVNLGKLSFTDLAQGLGQVLAFAPGLGVDLKQVGAAVAQLTLKGIPAAQAFTDVKGALAGLVKPSKGMQAAFKELGVTTGGELVKKTGSLQGALQALYVAAGGTQEGLQKLFPDVRAVSAAMDLVGKNAKGAGALLRGFAKDAGESQRVFEEQAKSTNHAFDVLRASAQSLEISIGSRFLPPLAKAAQAVAVFFDELESGKGAGGAVADDLRQAAEYVEKLVSAFGGAKDEFSGLGHEFETAAPALRDIGKLLLGIADVAARGLFGAMSHAVAGAADALHSLLAVIDAIDRAVHGDFGGAFAALKTAGVSAFRAVWQGFQAMMAPLKSLAAVLGHALEQPFRSAADTILGLFSSILSAGASVVRAMSGIPLIGGAFKGLANGIQAAADGIDHLRDRIRGIKPPPPIDIKAQAQTAAAERELRKLEGKKLGEKVVRVLADKKDADSKIHALIALGIPPKKARVLADVAPALIGIDSVKSALTTLHDKSIYIDTYNRVHNAAVSSPGAGFGSQPGKGTSITPSPKKAPVPPQAAGGKTSGPQLYLVGEGRDPVEWIIPRDPQHRGRATALLMDAAKSILPAAGGGAKHGAKHHATGKATPKHQPPPPPRYVPKHLNPLSLPVDDFQKREQSAKDALDKTRSALGDLPDKIKTVSASIRDIERRHPTTKAQKSNQADDLKRAKAKHAQLVKELSSARAARPRRLADWREAQAELKAANRYAARIQKQQDLADIASDAMQLADKQNDQGAYDKALGRYQKALADRQTLLTDALGHVRKGTPFYREIQKALGQVANDIQDASTVQSSAAQQADDDAAQGAKDASDQAAQDAKDTADKQAAVDRGEQLSDADQSFLDRLDANLSLAEVDTPNDKSDDLTAATALETFWESVLSSRRHSPTATAAAVKDAADAVLSARQTVTDLAQQVAQGGATAGPDASEALAAAVADQVGRFNNDRLSLYRDFGSNFTRARGDVTVNQHFEEPPADPHTWSKGLEFELRQAA